MQEGDNALFIKVPLNNNFYNINPDEYNLLALIKNSNKRYIASLPKDVNNDGFIYCGRVSNVIEYQKISEEKVIYKL